MHVSIRPYKDGTIYVYSFLGVGNRWKLDYDYIADSDPEKDVKVAQVLKKWAGYTECHI